MAAKEWYDWWLSEEGHGDTFEDVSQETWDAAIKFMEEKFTPTNISRDAIALAYEFEKLCDGATRKGVMHSFVEWLEQRHPC